MNIKRIDPPCWFIGLESIELQTLIYGDGIEKASVETNIPCVSFDVSSETQDSYLLLSLKLERDIKAGIYEILVRKQDETIKIPYELKESRKWESCDATITNEDVVYLLMPDRFAQVGDVKNKAIDRNNPNTWHGGNIKGMIQALDYLEKLGITAHNIYGLTELMGPGVSTECEYQTGLHIQEDHFYPEIIDSETGEVLEDGQKGELVLTNLTREGMPVIRFRTKDITALRRDECPCGRTTVRMDRITGRSDDMLKIKGVMVYPSQI